MQEKQSVMRPLDIVILLKKLCPEGYGMNGKQVAESLSISAAEVSIAMDRNRIAGLVDQRKSRINTLALKEFLVYGIRYCFPAGIGKLERGIPTASSASPISSKIASGTESYVWKDSSGTVRGQSITPLYDKAPLAARKDKDMYALLVIVDSFRIGKARERQVASEELDKYLERYAEHKQQ